MNFINKYICGILLIILTGYFFYTKDLNNKYDQVIMAEGHGYYVYLPAAFIYHDFTFSFFNEVSKKYYYPSYNPPTGNFINAFDGIRVNKYFPGVSLLWMPFFLLAHLLALLFHFPADGYSDVYQYAIGVAGVFYTYLGLKFTKKILSHFEIPSFIQSITLTIILFGTNMLLYSAAWSSQTHSYSFFLIAAFFWFVIRLFHDRYEKKGAALAWSFIFIALVVSLRPQNIWILIVLPFFGLTKTRLFEIVKKYLFTVAGITGMIIAFLIVGRVCWYWYIQTGRIFLNPYHGEHYFLNKPHVLDVLFSFRKGWILYSPFMAVGLAGIFFFKQSKDKINLLLFWGTFIYVSSCWWCWTYSSTSFGQRIYIDFYSLIALQAAMLFKYFYDRRLKFISPAVAFMTVPLCFLQTYQYKHGIIPGEYGTSETYVENFFITGPYSFYPVPKNSITDKTEFTFNFDEKTDSNLTANDFVSGKRSTFVSPSHPLSEQEFFKLPSFMTPGDYSIVRITTMAKIISEKNNPVLFIDFAREGKVISGNPFYMTACLQKLEWKKYQVGLTIPDDVLPGDSVAVYFKEENGTDTTYFDDLKIEFIHTDDSYEFRR